AANCGVEMTSPLASTLADVCSAQPSRRAKLASVAGFFVAGVWPKRRDEIKRAWRRMKTLIAARLPVFMALLINCSFCLEIRGGLLAQEPPRMDNTYINSFQ